MLLDPGVLAGGVLFRAMVPFVPNELPQLHGTNVLIVAGRRDRIVPPDQPAQLAGILERAGAEVSLHWGDGGHELGQNDVEAGKSWLDENV
jgi:predicted esterase